MINASGLLKDLQQELTRTVADIGAHVTADNEVRGRLETEWKQAFDAHRTGRTFEAWLEDRLTQVGVGWLLAVVFVRFCEDNRLITEPMIGGPGDRGAAARATQQRYFSEHPHDSDREYLHGVFRQAAQLPGLSGLLAEGESPLWLADPPADACTRMLALFRATNGDTGELTHDFTVADLNTRFLGDLYQDLSQQAHDDYALLQTPDFVEEFILDRTLTPALKTFGLANTTLIDPTCGSGHFLLSGFDRLWQMWRATEPAVPDREAAQRALSAVTGVDINPFAAAIARFRLLVAALKVCGIGDLRDAPDFTIDVAVGDSLLWGSRHGQIAGMEAVGAAAARQFLYRTEHADVLQRIFGTEYTAVVGNPPYIVCRDAALNQQYRERFHSCHRQYSLGVPFTELFFDLAVAPDHLGRPAGFVGEITANSFMKREFGKKLIEQYIPKWDLTHVIDTSGAYIPGHGTPTVVLFGRNQSPASPSIRTVMGIRGEPSTPADPAKGLVWSAIVAQVDEPGSESEYVSVGDTDRTRFAKHPWSIGGGGAAELKDRIETAGDCRLGSLIRECGRTAHTGDDESYFRSRSSLLTKGLSEFAIPFVAGEEVRDYAIEERAMALFPYSPNGESLGDLPGILGKELWNYRVPLKARLNFGQTNEERGLPWWEYSMFFVNRYRGFSGLSFSNVATHNYFCMVKGRRAFGSHAPVIVLNEPADAEGYQALLGVLNSSVACFWMQQVFHNKGSSVDAKGARQTTVAWDNFFEFDGTKLKQFPLPPGPAPVELARTLDALASDLSSHQPSAVCEAATPTRERLDAAHTESDRVFADMVTWQEELDWTCLHLYGLTEEPLTVPPGETPPPLALGERAFEIILARQAAAGTVDTAWFTRHRSTPVTDVPEHWPTWYRDLVQRRLDVIERDRDVALVERPEHKRRWARDPWDKSEAEALRSWLLDRLEDRALWFDGLGDAERAVCRSVAQLADRVARDDEFMGVARLWRGAVEIDSTAVVANLVADEQVPAQSASRYKPSGLAKRRQWERTWDLQRMEDRGQALPGGLERIPVPPKYGSGDFQKTSFWRQRGKLDVPKERFTSVSCAERDGDTTMVLAWAGFDHAQLAQAIGTMLVEREQTDGWDADRRWPMVVALTEQLPWLDQWHSEIDPRWGASPAQLYRGIAEQHALAGGRSLADMADWQPPAPTRSRSRSAT